MNEQDIEERLERLKGNYESMEERTNVPLIMESIKPTPQKKASPNKKWQIPLLSAAAVLLLFWLGSSMMPSNQDISLVDEPQEEPAEIVNEDFKEFTAELKSRYEAIEQQQFEKSGLTRDQYFSLPSVQSAKGAYMFYMSSDFLSAPQHDLDAGYIENLVMEFDYYLKTPRDYIEEVRPLGDGEVLDLYESFNLIAMYRMRAQEYQQAVNDETMNSTWISKDLADIRKLTDPAVHALLDFMQIGPLTYAGDVLLQPEMMAELIISLDNLYAQQSITFGPEKSDVVELVYLTLKGTMSAREEDHLEAIFKDGVLLESYQEQWKILANEESGTLSHQMFNPIVKEMEETGWTQSETWSQVDYSDVIVALELLDEGYYAATGAENKVLVDGNLQARVHELFKTRALTEGADKYKDVRPEELVALYYYYEELGELELLYEMYLQDETYMSISWAEYQTHYPHEVGRKLDSLVKELVFIDSGLDVMGDHRGVVKMILTEEGQRHFGHHVATFQLIKTEDGWKIPFMPTQ